jgi:hypothetical protein
LRRAQAAQPLERGLGVLLVDDPVIDPGTLEPPSRLSHEAAQLRRPLLEILVEARRKRRPRRAVGHGLPDWRRKRLDEARPLGQTQQIDDARAGSCENAPKAATSSSTCSCARMTIEHIRERVVSKDVEIAEPMRAARHARRESRRPARCPIRERVRLGLCCAEEPAVRPAPDERH